MMLEALIYGLACLGLIWLFLLYRSFRIACGIFCVLLAVLGGIAGIWWFIASDDYAGDAIIVALIAAVTLAIISGRRQYLTWRRYGTYR
jgi:hypothetical protein